MATFITGNVTGAAELEARLAQLGAQAPRAVTNAVLKGAALVAEAVREAAPDGPDAEGERKGKTSHAKIKNHIEVKQGKSRNPNAATALVHTGDAFQAGFYERGTIHQPPRPFMAPAFAASQEQALAAMTASLQATIDKASQ